MKLIAGSASPSGHFRQGQLKRARGGGIRALICGMPGQDGAYLARPLLDAMKGRGLRSL